MTALELLKQSYKTAQETFDSTVADITEEMLYKEPNGKALPLGAIYAHLVFCEDVIVQGMIQGKEALCESTFKDKTGASENMPAMDENWSENNEKWSRSVKFDLNKFVEYKKAVFKATEDYLNSLSDNDVDKEVDLGSWGKKSLAYIVYGMVTAHTNQLTGEISALKGIQGAKGYPF